MPLADSTSLIPDLTIDACHEAYITEVNRWRITEIKDGFRAVRDFRYVAEELQGQPEFLDFTDQGFAIDFLRWRGTKAAVEYFFNTFGSQPASNKISDQLADTPEDVPPPPTGDTDPQG